MPEYAIRIEERTSLTVDLDWSSDGDADSPLDLDLGAIIRSKGNKVHVAQQIGGLVRVRTEGGLLVTLADDDVGAEGHESLLATGLDDLDELVVFASIYSGGSDFSGIVCTASFRLDGQPAAAMPLTSDDPGARWCAIARCAVVGDTLTIEPLDEYFAAARQGADHFGFALDWTVGVK